MDLVAIEEIRRVKYRYLRCPGGYTQRIAARQAAVAERMLG